MKCKRCDEGKYCKEHDMIANTQSSDNPEDAINNDDD